MRVLVLTLLLLAPTVLALPSGLDAHIGLTNDETPTLDDPFGFLAFESASPGERYVFTVNSTRDYFTVEVGVSGAFDIERPKQLVPRLALDPNEKGCIAKPDDCLYDIFEPFATERVWEVDSPARVYHVSGTSTDFSLRFGIIGPVNATLTLTRDVTPPEVKLLPIELLTYQSFFATTNTNELSIVDMQVRKQGAKDWIQSPTPQFHVLQKFPIQGLDADSTYDVRILATDWADNVNEVPIFQVHTLPEPYRPKPTITILTPEPNTTVRATGVALLATIESNESPVPADGVRVFFDKKEVTQDAAYANGQVSYSPGALAPGHHSASVEVTNDAGGKTVKAWSFDVEGATNATPGLGALGLVAATAVSCLAVRTRMFVIRGGVASLRGDARQRR